MKYGQSDEDDTKFQQIPLTINTNDMLELPSSSVVASKKVSMPPFMKASLPILMYCVASIVMTVTNKYVVSGGDFNMVFLLLTVQSVVTVVFLQLFKFCNLIKYHEFEIETAKKWYPIVIFLVAMIYTGSKALQYLPIPVYTIFKNLTIIMIAYGEVLWFGGSVTSLMMLSFLLMTLSSVIAGWNDVTLALESLLDAAVVLTNGGLTILGYFWMAVNCFSTAAFVLYMRKRIKLTNFKDFDTVYYNNLLSIPLLIIPSLLLEDWSAKNLLLNFPPEERQARIWAMIFSGVSAFGMSYASAWCVRTTSSTTYSMVGSLNKLPIAISGIVFFGDPATFSNVSAIIIGFIAGMVYSVAKAYQNKKPEKPFTISSASSQSYSDANNEKN